MVNWTTSGWSPYQLSCEQICVVKGCSIRQDNEMRPKVSRAMFVVLTSPARHLGPGFHLGLDHLCVRIGLTSLSPSFPRTWRCPFPRWSTHQYSYLCAMMSFELRYPYDNDISISACGQNYYSTYFSRVCVCFQGHWISFWAHWHTGHQIVSNSFGA